MSNRPTSRSASKKPAKKQAAKARKKDLLDDDWWNTSKGIKEKYPDIENVRGWQRFRTEYDKADKQEHRQHEVARASWWIISPALILLRDLAEIAAGGEPHCRCQELRGISTSKAGVMLGKHVLRLVSSEGWGDMLELMQARKEEEKNRNENFTDHKSVVAEMVHAFLRFIEHNEELPSKKALNIEVNRIRNGLKKNDARWNDPFCDPPEFSAYLKSAGLSALPKAMRPSSWGG